MAKFPDRRPSRQTPTSAWFYGHIRPCRNCWRVGCTPSPADGERQQRIQLRLLSAARVLSQPPSPSIRSNMSQFSYEDLAAATGGFSQANLLGQGGFGYVHKGALSNKREVAVKSLKTGSGQGEREFQAEVEIISRVHHRHPVSLVGYCIANEQRLLVYEFVPNKTLEFHLHGKSLIFRDNCKNYP